MTTVSAERLATTFVEVADTLVDEFDLIDFLQVIADRATALVEAAAAGLMLTDVHGRLQFVAASDENARLLELFQLQHHEGPCLDAFRTAEPIVNADLHDPGTPWPRFAAEAVNLGFTTVHAFPLRLRAQGIGAMNVFSAAAGGFDDADSQILQALADVAAIAILQERAISRSELVTEQLQGALNSRIIIEQAKGAIAQVHGVTVDVAFTRIRAHARRTHRRLVEVAEAVVTDLASVPELARPATPAGPGRAGKHG